MDAIHFLHQMVASCAWILKGTTKVLPTNTGRQRINVLGAYEPRMQELIYLETLDSCNGDLVKALLEKVRALHPDVPVIFILDNVRYQHAPVVTTTAEALQIHLEYLPSYSPNLNLIERLWKLMKKIIVRNTYYPTFAEFVAAVRSFLANYKEYDKELRSLITENFQLLYAAWYSVADL